MSAEDHLLLEPHHVDNLIDAVRALNITIAGDRLERAKQHQQMLLVLQQIAAHTANLPALMDVLMGQKTNGGVHDVADRNEP